MLDTVLSLINHPFVEYTKEPNSYIEGEMSMDLMWGTTALAWNFIKFATHIIMMCLGLAKDDRTPDEMPDVADYDSTHHEAFMDD